MTAEDLRQHFFSILVPAASFAGTFLLLILSFYVRLYRRAESGDGDTPRFYKTRLQRWVDFLSSKVSPWKSKPSDLLSVRLWGIDAPEKGQEKWGSAARKRMNELLPPGDLCWLDWHGTAAWDRPCAEPFLLPLGKSLCIMLLEEGLAEVDSRYCDDARFFAAQHAAQVAKAGIWGDSSYLSARTYREQQRRLRASK